MSRVGWFGFAVLTLTATAVAGFALSGFALRFTGDLLLAARVALAAILAIAALAKLRAWDTFARDLDSWGLLRGRWLRVAAAAVIAGEVITSVILVAVPDGRVGGGLSAVLFGAFLLASTLAMRAGRSPHCGCFGELGRERLGLPSLLRLALLTCLGGAVALVDPTIQPRDIVADVSLGVGVALLIVELSATPRAYRALRARVTNPAHDGGRVNLSQAPMEARLDDAHA